MIDETAEEIADMQTHSSSAVAIKAARALRELTDREFPALEEYRRTLERNSDALRRANPSHASLHNTQREIVAAVDSAAPDSVEEAQRVTREAIAQVIDRVERGKQQAARNGADLLAGEEVLLVHDFSTTVLAAIETAASEGASFEVYVTEARPRYLGRKMARRLGAIEGVEATLIVDSANGHYLPDCDRVVVGMDCIVDGMLYNRVGTYPIAATAADVGVPMTVIGSAAKIVGDGFVFENEHRAPSEVMLEPVDGFEIANPAYDATPTDLLASVVTDQGTREP